MKAIIARAAMQSQVFIKDGNTNDIINIILKVIKNYNISAETKEFSQGFKPTYNDMKKLYWFVKDSIEYREDPAGFQWVRTPARTWHDRKAGLDCKSFTVFLVSIFQNLGLPYIVRFASYTKSQTPTHVYPLVKIGNRWVIMDAVWDSFDSEKSFTYKKDFKMSEIAVLSGTNNRRIINNRVGLVWNQPPVDYITDEVPSYDAETQRLIDEVSAITASIPESVISTDGGDITAMTGGEFSRWLAAKEFPSLASQIKNGLITSSTPPQLQEFILQTAGNTAPAFPFPFEESGTITGIFSKIGDWFKSQWKKIVNWLFKDRLKKSAEFFMYIFSNFSVLSPLLKKKREKQIASLTWMANASGQSLESYTATIRTHIITNSGGKTPETILAQAAAAGGKRQGIAPAVLAALPVILEIIQKIASLFKKKDAPVISAEDGSDLGEYGSEMGVPDVVVVTNQTDTTQPSGGSSTTPTTKPTKVNPYPPAQQGQSQQASEGGGNTGLLLGAAAILFFALK